MPLASARQHPENQKEIAGVSKHHRRSSNIAASSVWRELSKGTAWAGFSCNSSPSGGWAPTLPHRGGFLHLNYLGRRRWRGARSSEGRRRRRAELPCKLPRADVKLPRTRASQGAAATAQADFHRVKAEVRRRAPEARSGGNTVFTRRCSCARCFLESGIEASRPSEMCRA